ncbi:MAG: hypothetical protein MI924_06715 [Chloroflexales bacterium]|nr:hypothetical protein [Chloroflexales bacterium]
MFREQTMTVTSKRKLATTQHIWMFLAFVGLGLLLTWQQLRFWPFYIDDSYISLVYVKNWIEGRGLTYNGKFVEGYSHFLWVILLGIIGRFGIDLVLASRLLGMACALLTLPVFAALGNQICGRSSAGWLAGVLLAVSGPFLAWSVGGLETTLYILLLLLTIHLVLKEQAKRGPPFSAVAAILLALTRPEAIGLVVAIVFYITTATLRSSFPWKYLLSWIGIFALGYGLFLAWRFLYYQDWLPASVLAKRGSVSEQIDLAFRRLRPLLEAWGLAAYQSVIGFVLLFVLPTARRGPALLLTLVTVAYMAFIILSGDDWMPMFRYVTPLLPLLFLGLSAGVVALVDVISRGGRLTWQRWVLLLLFVSAPVWQIAHWTEQKREVAIDLAVSSIDGVKKLALHLVEEAPPGTTLAVIDAGALAYYTGLPTLDLIGLNDQHIAHLQGGFGQRIDVAYVLDTQPTYMVPHYKLSESGQPVFLDFPLFARLYYTVEFQRWYDPDPSLPMHPFVRRQTSHEQTMLDTFYKASYSQTKIQNALVGQDAQITTTIQNEGTGVWVGDRKLITGAVYVIFRLRDPATSQIVAEQWQSIGTDLAQGQEREVSVELTLPKQPGAYTLEIDTVLHDVAYFSEQGNPIELIPLEIEAAVN